MSWTPLTPSLPTGKGNSLAHSKQGEGWHDQICCRDFSGSTIQGCTGEERTKSRGKMVFLSWEVWSSPCVAHIINCNMLFYVPKEGNWYLNFQLYLNSRNVKIWKKMCILELLKCSCQRMSAWIFSAVSCVDFEGNKYLRNEHYTRFLSCAASLS